MKDILNLELKKCFDFFWNESNSEIGSKGYGLMLDRSNDKNIASIASVGFAITSYVIGVKRNWITKEQAIERVIGTMKTLAYNIAQHDGFFIHFCNMKTGERLKDSEFSTIDTALAINGVITADSFFDNEEVHKLSKIIMDRVKWESLIYTENKKTYFHMAYNDSKDSNYYKDRLGYDGGWTMCAEQLMMYIQAAGKDDISEKLAKDLYLGFDRTYKEYGGYGCYYEPGGALFTYQYSHAWFDFSKYVGCDDINWHLNSKNATLAQIAWCNDHMEYETFKEGLWGVSAYDGPTGYTVQGVEPKKETPKVDGTIGPCAIFGSLPFTFEESKKAIEYLYNNHPEIWGEYGFKDSYNAQNQWYAPTYLGIDKGETLIMIANVLYGDVWEEYMKHRVVKKAIKKLGFKKV